VGTFIRGALVVIGIVLMLAGLLAIMAVPALGTFGGLELVAIGAFLVLVVVFERQRYRSASAEGTNAPPGPGGGEPLGGPLEPRFRPTAEVFIDPTTGHRMRVVVDPANGERRYVAEG
jgi:hypothetical protein